MIFRLSWKNVWRNKVRSMVVIISVMLGIFGGVMATGIMQGWIEQRIHSSIHNEISHVQIHNPEYMYNEEIKLTIPNYDTVKEALDTSSLLKAWSPRVKIQAMANNARSSTGFTVKGVDPEKEKTVSEIYKQLVAGDFLEGEHRSPSIVIGNETAKTLKILNYKVTQEGLDTLDKEKVPERIKQKVSALNGKLFRVESKIEESLAATLTKAEMKEFGEFIIDHFSFYRLGTSIMLSTQDIKGSIVYPVFKVRGVYKTDNSAFDAMNAFVDQKALNKHTLLGPDEIHEIAIICEENEDAVILADQLKKALPKADVLSWRELSPEIAMYTDFSNVMGYIYVGIILLALAFGIINSMLMSVLERVKELGMLMAIGMNKKKVFRMIMTESVMLSLTGAVAGMIFSGILVAILSRTGINFDMWSEGFEAMGYASVVYPEVTTLNYIVITIMVIITGIIASIWPARKALKLNPVEALRTE